MAQTYEEKKREVIDECGFELATNFDLPAIRILEYHGWRLGLSATEMQALMSSRYSEND